MTPGEIAGLLSIPFTVLSTGAALFMGVALATKKNRTETIAALEAINFGDAKFVDLASIWGTLFERLFGRTIFATRQLVTIPLYTLAVSGIFFVIWIVYLYLFRNPEFSFTAPLPFNVTQAMKDFYSKGIYASFLIDIVAIQMTKRCIGLGKKYGFENYRFYSSFVVSILCSSILFVFVVFFFRFEDMVNLYQMVAPVDPLPVMPFTPVEYFHSSLALFQPLTILHVTSRGVVSSYFMPESLIFYCGVTAQLSLLFIALAHQIAIVLAKIRVLSIGFVGKVGTPEASSRSVIVMIVLYMLALPLIGLVLIAFFK